MSSSSNPPSAEDRWPTVLIAFDGSDDAVAAIAHCARLLPEARCTVLTIWEPYVDTVARAGAGFGVVTDFETESVDESSEAAAQRTADNGAERARGHDLRATSMVSPRHGELANVIVSVARETDAAVIVMGHRGRSGVKTLLLGSVAKGVVQHAERPVMIVPSTAGAPGRIGTGTAEGRA